MRRAGLTSIRFDVLQLKNTFLCLFPGTFQSLLEVVRVPGEDSSMDFVFNTV